MLSRSTLVAEELQARLQALLQNCAINAHSLANLKVECARLESEKIQHENELDGALAYEKECQCVLDEKKERFQTLISERDRLRQEISALRADNFSGSKLLDSLEQQFQATQHLYDRAVEKRMQTKQSLDQILEKVENVAGEHIQYDRHVANLQFEIASYSAKAERLRDKLSGLLLSADQSLRGSTFSSSTLNSTQRIPRTPPNG